MCCVYSSGVQKTKRNVNDIVLLHIQYVNDVFTLARPSVQKK